MAKILTAMFLMLFTYHIFASNLYVDNSGNDNNNGSLSSPLKTIQGALTKAQTMTSAMQADINIYIRGGKYKLTQPIQIGPQHSGKNGYYVNLRAYLTDTVLISGGKDTVVSGWNNYSQNTNIKYKAILNVPAFRNLYINGVKGQRARSNDLNRQINDGCLYTENNGNGNDPNPFSFIGAPIQDVSGNWYIPSPQINYDISQNPQFNSAFFNNASNFPGVEFVYYDPARWRMFRWVPPSINKSNHQIPFPNNFSGCPFWGTNSWVWTNGTGDYPKREGVRWAENALELLDQPNEWYYSTTGSLYYYPLTGSDINNTTFTIPSQNNLVLISGTSDANKVSNIRIIGLNFAYTSFLLNPDWGFATDQFQAVLDNWTAKNLPAAMEVIYSDNITVAGNSFTNLGADAINIKRRCNNIQIDGNSIHDISGSGIIVGEVEYQTAIDINDFASKYQALSNTYLDNNILVKFNNISNIGNEYYSSVGIYRGFSENIIISNNTILNTPYCGIYIGYGWDHSWLNIAKNIDIGFNKVGNNCLHLRDGAAIYATGFEGNNLIEGTKIHDNFVTGWHGTSGIYLDNGMQWASVFNNVLFNGTCGYWLYLQNTVSLNGDYCTSGDAINNYLYSNHSIPSDDPYGVRDPVTNRVKSPANPNNPIYNCNTWGAGELAHWFEADINWFNWGYYLNPNTDHYNNITGSLPDWAPTITEFYQKPSDFNSVDLNLSVFQTLVVPDL